MLSANDSDKQNRPRWIWFITGPTACGKTTVAKALAQTLGLTFVEGDDYHPPSNREKLSHNQPLTDADRAAWLDALCKLESSSPSTPAPANSDSPPPGNRNDNLVVTCSARKRRYRDVLRQGAPAGEREARVRFVFLDVDEDVLRERARERKGHCAGEGLIGSQMDALERPGHGEEGDVVVVRVSRGMEVEETVGEVERRVREAMARGS